MAVLDGWILPSTWATSLAMAQGALLSQALTRCSHLSCPAGDAAKTIIASFCALWHFFLNIAT